MRRRAALVLVCTVSGCASLTVTVDTYKGTIPVLAGEMSRYVDAVLANPAFSDDTRSEFYRVSKTRMLDEAKNRAKTANVDASFVAESIAPLLDDEWARVDSKARSARETGLALKTTTAWNRTSPPSPEQSRQYRDLIDSLQDYEAQIEQFIERTQPLFRNLVTENFLRVTLDPIRVSTSGIAASADLSGRHVGTPLFDVRMSRLDRSPRAWSSFGTTNFSAIGGNAQFVVLREGLLVFHQKSLDFDPTPVVGAGSAVFRAGLKVAAAVATGATGLPVSAIAPKGDGSPTAEVFDEADLDIRKDTLERRNEAKVTLLRTLRATREGKDAAAMKRSLVSSVALYKAQVAVPKAE